MLETSVNSVLHFYFNADLMLHLADYQMVLDHFVFFCYFLKFNFRS